jgi:hypothetical protein
VEELTLVGAGHVTPQILRGKLKLISGRGIVEEFVAFGKFQFYLLYFLGDKNVICNKKS